MVTGMHLTGRGRTDFETLCAILNRPKPMTPNTYSNYEKALHAAAVDIAKQSMLFWLSLPYHTVALFPGLLHLWF